MTAPKKTTPKQEQPVENPAPGVPFVASLDQLKEQSQEAAPKKKG